MYEKQRIPPCGARNSYVWNKSIGEIADVIEDIALLRIEKLHLLEKDSTGQLHCGISKEQLACAELCSIRLERTSVIAVDADEGTLEFKSVRHQVAAEDTLLQRYEGYDSCSYCATIKVETS